MRCIRCHQPIASLDAVCPHCQFTGDPALVEELAHVRWLTEQIGTWTMLGASERQRLEQQYRIRQHELEIKLALRPPPFDDAQARAAWPALFQRQALLQALRVWRAAHLAEPGPVQAMTEEVSREIEGLRDQLAGRAAPPMPQGELGGLARIDYLLQALERLNVQGGFVSAEAAARASAPLRAAKSDLEARLGAAAGPPAPGPASAAMQPAREPAADPRAQGAAPALPTQPALPWRDRLWRTLLSERTLGAMLFLGIFLVFSAAISFAIWGWRDFTAPLRVAIPTAFTVLFFGLGAGVRRRTALYRSGIALTVIGALLIPVDLYTVYANYSIPPDLGPWFWLLTSLLCLLAYTVATLVIQAPALGYLVGAAAGSTVLAAVAVTHQRLGLSLDWQTAGLSVLAGGFVVAANALARAGRWRVVADPLRHLALVTVGAVMLLSFGWRYTGRPAIDTLHYAMSVNWLLGGLIFAWGAIHHRSRSLGLLAALALPVATYMGQAALFDWAHLNQAWHGLGLALLVPAYLVAGHTLLRRREDPVLYGHGRMATGWGAALLAVAAVWSLTDMTGSAPAAWCHAILAGSAVLAALLWQRPALLYVASLFSLTSLTFTMMELNLPLAQAGIGWVSLSIAHVIVALRVGRPRGRSADAAGPAAARSMDCAAPLVVAGTAIAALALLPSLMPYDGRRLAYVLGHWLVLAAWAARLAHERRPGFATPDGQSRLPFQWFAALPLPLWVWLLFANRGPLDASLPLCLAALAWALVGLSARLAHVARSYRRPWYVAGLLTSAASPLAAFAIAPHGLAPALCLVAVGLLYIVDAVAQQQSLELAPGALVTAWGCALWLDRVHASFDGLAFALAALAALYLLAGLWVERRRSPRFTHHFLRPWYASAHLVALTALFLIYARPWNALALGAQWTDGMRLWGAAGQTLLGLAYILYGWGTFEEGWAYAAAWLLAGGGGFVAVSYSGGRGSLAARGALIATAFVLAERALHGLRGRRGRGRRQAIVRLAWRLYRRPLLVTGWAASAGAIGVALLRNLVLLGGGRTREIWAAVALLMVTALYALAARLFRQARFLWLAALLILVPWTILTHLGWLVAPQPRAPSFAVSWVALAWLLYLAALALARRAPQAFSWPPKTVAHVLLPAALLWGVADAPTGRITFGLAIAFYGLAATLEHRRQKGALRPGAGAAAAWGARFLYPALGLVPVWSVYLLGWLAPAARHEHYGLLLAGLGALGLVAGRLLERLAPRREAAGAYGLPAYLAGYASAIIGTLLVAHDQRLLAAVLLYDALLALASAWLFRHPLWVYPAASLAPLALLLELDHAGVSANRLGWWLIGLAAVYLAAAWLLRRRAGLWAYGSALLAVGLALIALGLPPSSGDRTGALWGYGAAAALYAATAFWLRQPLLLAPACGLALVPYAVALQQSGMRAAYHGLALFPGALTALGAGWLLDARRGTCRGFPWGRPAQWPAEMLGRLVDWWALAPYALGLGLAAASPFFTASRAGLSALNCLLLVPIFGWAMGRFRLRGWLVAAAVAAHAAAILYLRELGWWQYPAYAWLRFVPVTLLTAGLGLWIERRRKEGPPLEAGRWLAGWSRPLYGLALADLAVAQALSLGRTDAGAALALVHALLVAGLASCWSSRRMPYLSAALGALALGEWLASLGWPLAGWPVPLARLALGYGLVGYGLAYLSRWKEGRLPAWLTVWARPLARFGIGLSLAILLVTAYLGPSLALWTGLALLGLPFRQLVELATVQMVVGVLSLVGLLYVAAAFVGRKRQLGYEAIGMLLVAWALHAFYVRAWDGAAQVQWYAMPAGLYLLGIGWLEWKHGSKTLGRWLDYAAMLLLMGSLFWQALLFGWRYALMLGCEGFVALWWGSARRLRRFLYAGMMGVILATTAQLINSLRSVNQWVVFGVIGLLVVGAAIAIERRLEEIKAWRQTLESWE